MKILIDIGHPAHVHYFRNFINTMKAKGHEFLICARDKDVTHELLNGYNIDYVSRGKGRKGIVGKAFYIIEGDVILLKFARKFKPDLFLSFGSTYAAHVAKLIGKPHIALDDTEHAKLEHMLYVPFTNCVITPKTFKKNFGSKHITFSGTMENAYLHPSFYEPDFNYLEQIGLNKTKYFVLRFIEWSASHDIGHNGVSKKDMEMLINSLEKLGKVVISSESELPDNFKHLKYNGDVTKIHTLLKGAELLICESGTMASEAAVLGTPTILINSLVKEDDGIFSFLKKYGNLYHYQDFAGGIMKLKELLTVENIKSDSIKSSSNYFSDTINLTDFLVWMVENYPESHQIIRQNPDYQERFKL
ncbi:MAG: DUF354 domain-containing protein [Candidatus Cloacimonetes bacterium]|nr:DUF354 domain-containing protein [Candidatus Cloacimonadota bacterium]